MNNISDKKKSEIDLKSLGLSQKKITSQLDNFTNDSKGDDDSLTSKISDEGKTTAKGEEE